MENNLPKGWVVVKAVDAIYFLPTGIVDYSGTKDYYSTGSIQNNRFIPEGKFSYVDKPSRANRIAELGDVFQARMKDTDKGVLIDKNLKGQLFSTGFIQVRPFSDTFNNKLLYYLAKSDFFLNQKNRLATGSTQEALTDSKVGEIEIPLPPLSEQHRIVAKLDALMEKVECNKQRLDKIPTLLKRFRQSVLAAGVSGNLVESLSEWKEVELNSLLEKGGIFDGPFGSNLKTVDYVDKGVRVIRLENIEHLFFIHEKQTFITEEKYKSLKRHTVGEGDIIFSSFISEEIRACILPKLKTKAIAKADCFCIRPDIKKVDKKFLLLTLVSRNSFDQIALNIHGATRPRINTTQLKKLILSIPVLSEQKEIILRVEQLFAFADKVETRYTKAKTMSDKLPQSILAKAFRGELVPQNPEDEPASVLLERIKKEKVKYKENKRTTRIRQKK